MDESDYRSLDGLMDIIQDQLDELKRMNNALYMLERR